MIPQQRPAYFAAPGFIIGWRQEDRQYRHNMVIAQVCEYLGVPMHLLERKTRKREVVEARHISMFFIHKLTGMTLLETGKLFGNRDHTTVLYAVGKVNDLMYSDPQFKKKVEYLSTVL